MSFDIQQCRRQIRTFGHMSLITTVYSFELPIMLHEIRTVLNLNGKGGRVADCTKIQPAKSLHYWGLF